jgi:hypothetical protein
MHRARIYMQLASFYHLIECAALPFHVLSQHTESIGRLINFRFNAMIFFTQYFVDFSNIFTTSQSVSLIHAKCEIERDRNVAIFEQLFYVTSRVLSWFFNGI